MFRGLRGQILLLASFPITILLALGGWTALSQWRNAEEFEQLEIQAKAASMAGNIIHQLQKERGLTANFIALDGKAELASDLRQQHALTDQALVPYFKIIASTKIKNVPERVQTIMKRLYTDLHKIGGHRQDVGRQKMTVVNNVAYYTNHIETLIRMISLIIKESPSVKLNQQLEPFLALVSAKEYGGLERAFGSAILRDIIKGDLNNTFYREFLFRNHAEKIALQQFRSIAQQEHIELFSRTVQGPDVDKISAWRKIIARIPESGEGEDITSKAWFDAATKRLDLLKVVEDQISSLALKTAVNDSAAAKAAFYVSLVTIIVTILTITLLLLAQGQRFSNRVSNVAGSIREFAEGDLSVPIKGIEAPDEIGDIVRMTNLWRQSVKEKDRLYNEIKHRSAIMDLMNKVAAAANLSSNQTEAFEKCLELICEFTGWEAGHVWELENDGSDGAYPLGCWHLSDKERYSPFVKQTEQSAFHFGQGIQCSSCASGETAFARCIVKGNECPRAKAAAGCGLVSCIVVPVKIREEIVTVLDFFSSTNIEPGPQLIEILMHIGTQMGRVVERSRAEKQSFDHMQHLEVLVGNATDELRSKAEKLEEALEREKQLNIIQRQFVSMASHEFRTPLAIIDGAAQRLHGRKDKANGEEIESRIGMIRKAVKRMTGVMESILSAGRMEEGKLNITISQCHIHDLIRDVCTHQQGISTTHRIRINLLDLPKTIQADGSMLGQALTNLLSNAVKYSPGKPDILVKGWREEADVLISVQDNGLGIDDEDLPKMFERYFRAKTSAGIAGTGIGLNLAKAFVEEHNGQITVESKKGEGSAFTIRLAIAGPGLQEEEMGEALGNVA